MEMEWQRFSFSLALSFPTGSDWIERVVLLSPNDFCDEVIGEKTGGAEMESKQKGSARALCLDDEECWREIVSKCKTQCFILMSDPATWAKRPA